LTVFVYLYCSNIDPSISILERTKCFPLEAIIFVLSVDILRGLACQQTDSKKRKFTRPSGCSLYSTASLFYLTTDGCHFLSALFSYEPSPSADRPHARFRSGGKWKTTVEFSARKLCTLLGQWPALQAPVSTVSTVTLHCVVFW